MTDTPDQTVLTSAEDRATDTRVFARPNLVLTIAVSILCTLVVVVFARLAYGLVLPTMRISLNQNYAQAANLGTVTAMGYLLLVLPAGIFASRFGARKAILLGLAFAIIGFSGLALASSYITLMILMVALGAATAFAYTPLISLLGNWFPERRGTVIGFANSGVGTGMLLTGALVPMLTVDGADPDTGWRLVWAIFAISAGLCAILAALIFRDLPQAKSGPGEIPPSPGIATVYRNRHVVITALIYGVVGVTYIVQSLFMYSYALESGLTPTVAGRLVALMGMLSIVAGPSWGWGADHIGHSRALMICMTLALTGTAVPVLWPVLPGFILHYTLMGLSITGLFTSILASTTRTVAREQAAVAISFVTLFFALGQLLGPALMGQLLERTGNFQLGFAYSCILLTVGIYLSWLSGKK